MDDKGKRGDRQTHRRANQRNAKTAAAATKSGMARKRNPKRTKPSSSSSSIDWAKFTNFKSRNTRQDLERLLNETKADRRKELLETPDDVGLYPMHWAAINNRPEFIECLSAAGSSLAKKCRNSLFADGTPLHLAAMNSSLEAAAALLNKSLELERHQTRPKSVSERKETTTSEAKASRDESKAQPSDDINEIKSVIGEMLEARDADGQTPLMRSAAPRSKKLNTFRELLLKNFWSLSGRPAEMALFLICMGADWRKTEPVNGMNLMHLAIMNDHDDIVSLLLVLDKSLIDVATMKTNDRQTTTKAPEIHRNNRSPSSTSSGSEFKIVRLDSSQDEKKRKSERRAKVSPTQRPLIDSNRENANELLMRGLTPLQLAILYGRVRIIGALWRFKTSNRPDSDEPQRAKRREKSGASHSESPKDDQQLKRTLIRACFSDKDQLAKFMKPLLLKVMLALDLTVLALVWAPLYCSSAYFEYSNKIQQRQTEQPSDHQVLIQQSTWPGMRGGLFFVSFCITLALTLRVTIKNPGFLRRHSVHYLSELAKLLNGAPKAREAIANRLGHEVEGGGGPTKDESSTSAKVDRRPSSPLIKLDETTSIVPDGARVSRQEQSNENKTTLLAMNKTTNDRLAPEEQTKQIQFGVRHLCHRCQCIRRPRSRHCSFCDHCVQDFDHHCIYLGCCIGRNNRLDLLLAMIALAITSIYGTILQTSSMRHINWSRFWHMVAFLWVFKYVIIGSVSAFLILRRACLGVTLYEEVRSQRLRRIFGRRGPPEQISKTHPTLSTLEGSFWRYLPYDQAGDDDSDKSANQIMKNLREFANNISPDEYLLTLMCTDAPLTRSLLSRSNDLRIKQQQLHKLA
jgi:ankyrin repeat protein